MYDEDFYQSNLQEGQLFVNQWLTH